MVRPDDVLVKTISKGWNKDKYYNIWICPFMDGNKSGAYSTFPDPRLPKELDGTAIHYEAVGTQYLSGRALVHETGHWFALWHTFHKQKGIDLGDGIPFTQVSSCNENPAFAKILGNQVADTPPTDADNGYLVSQCDLAQVCVNTAYMATISAKNYMGRHQKESCIDHFTTGQIIRMYEALKKYRSELLGGRKENDSLPSIGNDTLPTSGRPEGCNSCVACSPTKGKIEGNNIVCHNEIVTYKFLGGEAYGCSFTWNVIGGTFPDYANGIIASQTYGFPSYTDSIRVRWDGTAPIRELRCLPTKCEVTDDLVLVRPNTFTPTLRATKQAAFVPSSLVVAEAVLAVVATV